MRKHQYIVGVEQMIASGKGSRKIDTIDHQIVNEVKNQVFDMYSPVITSFLVFFNKDKKYNTGQMLKHLQKKVLKDGERLLHQDRLILFALRDETLGGNLGETRNNVNDFIAVDPEEISKKRIRMTNIAISRSRSIGKKVKGINYVGHFSIIHCGSKKEYWTDAQVDILNGPGGNQKGESVYGGMTSVLNLDIMNNICFNAEDIYTSKVRTPILNMKIFGFKKGILKKDSFIDVISDAPIPKNYFMTYDHHDGLFTGDGLGSETKSKVNLREGGDYFDNVLIDKSGIRSQFSKTVDRVGIYIGYHVFLDFFNRDELLDSMKEVKAIRKNIHKLQKDIDIILEMKKVRKHRKDYHVIYDSSVYSAQLTEINENMATNVLFLRERQRLIQDFETEEQFHSLKKPTAMSDMIRDLQSEFNNWRDKILRDADMVARTIGDLQDRLRNVVEVFNTYRESVRRKNQRRLNYGMNIIFAALALVEMSDFIGGLIIYALNHQDYITALEMFLEIFIVLIIVGFLLNLFVQKKIWDS